MAKKITRKSIIERVKKDKVGFIQLQFTDINGSIKSVTIPIHNLTESLDKGLWFDGSSIDGFTRIFENDIFLTRTSRNYNIEELRD